jgi:elongator complex protein 3
MKKKIFGVRQNVENPQKVEQFFLELCKDVPKNMADLEKKKRNFCMREKGTPILNRDLIAVMQASKGVKIPETLEKILQKRSVRTISGVTPIGILTKPYPCPGKCVYCPTDVRMPKSYLASQPAAARALRNKFHPFDQVANRITAVQDSGHPVSKLEVIVMGGTWSFLPHKYQSWYVKNIFDAANKQSSNKQSSISNLQTSKGKSSIFNPQSSKEQRSHSLRESQKINETAEHRVIGLTLETRPDFITEKELVRMREMGCTRIEIGVQTLDDEVSKLTKRGHYRSHVAKATKLMRDFGFKICYHLMPGLPGSTPEKDLTMMREVFENPDFCPDFVKIYPCQVLDKSELKDWWEKGKFQPLRDKELVKLLLKFKQYVPPWVRIMRLLRDIPVDDILDGARFSNLRQILKSQPKKVEEILGSDTDSKDAFDVESVSKFKEWPCKCIRCREIGFQSSIFNPSTSLGTGLQSSNLKLVRRDYPAGDGLETFLSFESEDEKVLFALLRLRKPSGQKFSKFGSVLHDAALIREVHSYGSEVSVGEEAGAGQHRGLGKKLLIEAERIARDEWGMKKMTIIAGVGTREYYRKFEYELRSTYMVKQLRVNS